MPTLFTRFTSYRVMTIRRVRREQFICYVSRESHHIRLSIQTSMQTLPWAVRLDLYLHQVELLGIRISDLLSLTNCNGIRCFLGLNQLRYDVFGLN